MVLAWLFLGLGLTACATTNGYGSGRGLSNDEMNEVLKDDPKHQDLAAHYRPKEASTPPSSIDTSNYRAAMTLYTTDNRVQSSTQFAGKVVLYDFFTTYAPQSPVMMPRYDELYRRYKDSGFVVVGVSLDMQGQALVPPFLDTMDISYPVFLADEKTRGGETPFGFIKEIPVSILTDRKGRQVEGFLGAVKRKQLESAIRRALGL